MQARKMIMESSDEIRSATQRSVPPLARRFVRYIVGFGVGVGVGLAPYLGLLRIPLFAPLLDLIPDSIQNTLIPLSAALMGLLAVVVQWYAGEHITRRWLRRLFARTLLAVTLAFVVLLIIHTTTVVKVPIEGGNDSASFVVGFSRPYRPPCTQDVSDAECIKKITLDTSAIESYWGDRQVRLARLSLMLSYLLFTSSFGALIGVILLREVVASRGRPAGRVAT